MKLMKNRFWKPWNIFTLPPNLSAHRIAKITIDVLLRQEMPDKNHPLPAVIWVIVPGDLEELWAYPQPAGPPHKIALLALNSTIFSLLLLSISENIGQRQDVDVLLKGRFTPPPGPSQRLTHWLDVQFTPLLRDGAWNLIHLLSSASVCPERTNTGRLLASAADVLLH